MRLTILFLCLAAFSLTSSPLSACGRDDNLFAYIHDALPTPLPAGAFVAEVEFEPQETDDAHGAIVGDNVRGRIIRHIQGDYGGLEILVRRDFRTSCDAELSNGRRGLVVARPLGVEDGVLVIDPILVMPSQGYRLPDGYQFPPPSPLSPQSVESLIKQLTTP